MRVLLVVDSPWATGKLCETIAEGNAHHKMDILAIHPKEYRANTEQFNTLFLNRVAVFKPDLIHFHYWDTAFHLANLPGVEAIPKILTHHNQKNLLSHDWTAFSALVVHTKKAKQILDDAGYQNVQIIRHGIDIEHFHFAESYDIGNRLLGSVGRVVPWKNLFGILWAADQLDTKVVMMGKIDKADYWRTCLEFESRMLNNFGVSYEGQPDVYHEMGVYIGNSSDNIEEGTLGLLEAMACGIPVITTPAGEAADIIEHGKNGLLIPFEDPEALVDAIKTFWSMTPKEKLEMRENAWNTVRTMSKGMMARKYEKLYYSLVHKSDVVSVIIPTCGRAKTLEQILEAYASQLYKIPLEIVVVVDDTFDTSYEVLFEAFRKRSDTPIKWAYTNSKEYGLAKARNMGIFLAVGNFLLFNDDRFKPHPDTVFFFLEKLKPLKELSAVWGDKGSGQRDFIENFFMIRKKHIVQAGMFNERINEYGGQSQEFRTRLSRQGFCLAFCPGARAIPLFGTHSRTKRRYELFRMKEKLTLLDL